MSKTTAEFDMCSISAVTEKLQMGIHVENGGLYTMKMSEILFKRRNNKWKDIPDYIRN